MDGAEIQFSKHRTAKESALCGGGNISCVAVFELGPKSRRLAGAGAVTVGDGCNSLIPIGRFCRPMAACIGKKSGGKGSTRVGQRAAAERGVPQASASANVGSP